MKKIGLLLMVLILLLIGCGGEKNTSENPGDDKGGNEPVESIKKPDDEAEIEEYVFEYKGITIAMNEKAASILGRLGEPLDYFEAESCAFEGLDKIYTYSGFELHTYEIKGVDYVAAVMFLDDSVSTKEGAYLYSDLDDVLSKYDDNYVKDLGLYTYELNKSKISFLVEDDEVVSIEYNAITE